jgi:tripartite-type tricarboxylate transporter receptor subunit TctC
VDARHKAGHHDSEFLQGEEAMKRVLAGAAVMAAALFVTPASAADYPDKPIHVFTTSGAGGLSDVFMRVLGDELNKRVGQPLIIDNRPGGAGNIAARACAEAPPDGYTICIISIDPIAYNQFLFKKLPFDPQKLTPIVNLFNIIQVLVVNSDLKVKSVDELVALSKQKAGTLSYLTASLPLVVYMESLKRDKGADWVRVPFKGGGQATNAVLGGSTPIALIGLGNVIAYIEAGKMTALAMTNNVKSPQLPAVPTLADTGYKGPPSRTWYGLFAPAGTPKAIIDKLNKEIRAVAGDKEFNEKHIVARSLVAVLNSPEQFAAEIEEDRKVAEQVVKASGMEAR